MTPDEVAGRAGALLGLPARADHATATVDVPRERWTAAVAAVRDDPELDLAMFDVLTAVDEQPDGFAVVLRLWSPAGRHGLVLLTRCPREDARVPTLTGLFGGADWHERAAAEMFGLVFDGHPAPGPLLLPEDFGAHPLRKDFVLASRAVRPWPGAVEPGQSAADAAEAAERRPARRRATPPGVPPAPWGGRP